MPLASPAMAVGSLPLVPPRKPKLVLCCAELLSRVLLFLYPVDCIPPGSSVHGDSPGKNTGVGGHALFQGILPTQGLNLGLPHCR